MNDETRMRLEYLYRMLTAMEYSKWTFCREVFFAYRNVDIGFLQQTAGRLLQKALKPETK